MSTIHQLPWVIFSLVDQQFAVSADKVREMVKIPPVVRVPGAAVHVRGVMNLRGKVMPVIDMRLAMGMPSACSEIDELTALLVQREQDHKNWLAELEASVREKRPFTLATDPHKCAFGLWYDAYETENRVLAACLNKFNAPHKKIHAIAVEVKALEEAGEFHQAFEIIEQTRANELTRMVALFEEARLLLKESRKEIALVLEHEGQLTALAVDAIETIEKIPDSQIEHHLMAETTADCITGIGKRPDNKGIVQLLDAGRLVGNPA